MLFHLISIPLHLKVSWRLRNTSYGTANYVYYIDIIFISVKYPDLRIVFLFKYLLFFRNIFAFVAMSSCMTCPWAVLVTLSCTDDLRMHVSRGFQTASPNDAFLPVLKMVYLQAYFVLVISLWRGSQFSHSFLIACRSCGQKGENAWGCIKRSIIEYV